MSAKTRRRVLILLGALAGLNAAVFLAYTLPRARGERRLAERRRLVQAEVERERAVTAQRQRYGETLRANAEDVRRFYDGSVAGRTSSLVPVLRAIEGFARQGGMRPGSASYRQLEVKGLKLNQFVVTMPVDGTYRQLVALVQQLERSKYFVTLDEVRLSGGAQGKGAELSLMLSCYFKAGERAAEKAPEKNAS